MSKEDDEVRFLILSTMVHTGAIALAVALFAIWLSGCAAVFTKHNVSAYDARFPEEQLEAAVEYFGEELAAGGVVPEGVAPLLLAHRFFSIEWVDGKVPCAGALLNCKKDKDGNVLDADCMPNGFRRARQGELFGGCREGNLLRLRAFECLGNTAFVHELGHDLAEQVLPPNVELGRMGVVLEGDPDYGHQDRRIWDQPLDDPPTLGAEGRANERLRERFCGGA